MERIYVTKSFLPPLEEYDVYLREIWKSGHLTNQGPLLKQFENQAQDYLRVDNFHFISNGTTALQIALKALDITEGEVITTPFSFVATMNSIMWERCDPIFVDIEPETFCINADKIEAAITKNTKAIMAVHVFGYPCDVEKIEEIANKHGLKVIYDGAHAFGVEYKGKSLLSYGDITTCSFHSTKLFHTIEGGAVVAKDKVVSDKIELLKKFGFEGDEYILPGINAKASEFQAAMGLCNMRYIDDIIESRRKIHEAYNELLSNDLLTPVIKKNVTHNYTYYPVLFKTEAALLHILSRLQEENIFPRRYFNPSLNTVPYVGHYQRCLVSEDITKRILCLPLYPDLKINDVERICRIINNNYAD